MQNQIELPFRGDRKPCPSVRRNRRAQWARLWFARMHEVVEEAGERTLADKAEHNQLAQPHRAIKEDQESPQNPTS